MNPEDVVRGEFDAWSRLDLDEIMSYFAPDAVWDNVPIGAVSGHEAIRAAAAGWLHRTNSARLEILHLAVSGPLVLTERVDHFVMDGRAVHARVMGAFEISDDKIVSWRDYFDMSGAPSGGSSKELMKRITEEIWNNRRLDLIPELISDDLVDHVVVPGLERTGQARYRDHVELIREAFSDFRNELDLVVAEGDLAVSYGRVVGTNDGPMMGMPPTGRRVDCETIGILRFADGKAVERWGVADNVVMMQQLGLLG